MFSEDRCNSELVDRSVFQYKDFYERTSKAVDNMAAMLAEAMISDSGMYLPCYIF